MPGGVLAGMAGAARSRRHIPIAGDFNRPIGRLSTRRRGAGGEKSSKNGQGREILGLARAPEWAHHFCQDNRLMLQRRL